MDLPVGHDTSRLRRRNEAPRRETSCQAESGGKRVYERPGQRHHADDDSVFIDDRYVIKGLSGRILAPMVRTFVTEGRTDFSNKELRTDPTPRFLQSLPGSADALATEDTLERLAHASSVIERSYFSSSREGGALSPKLDALGLPEAEPRTDLDAFVAASQSRPASS